MENRVVNVCWNQESGEVGGWGFEVAKLLRKKGINVRFVVVIKKIYNEAIKLGFECEFISPQGYHGITLSQNELNGLDEKYGPPGMRLIADSTAHFDWLKLKKSERIQIVARHYQFWEKYGRCASSERR